MALAVSHTRRLCCLCDLGEPEIPLIPSSCVSAGLRSSVWAQEESGAFVVSLFHSNAWGDDSLDFFFLFKLGHRLGVIFD